jgi:hypothetical protein
LCLPVSVLQSAGNRGARGAPLGGGTGASAPVIYPVSRARRVTGARYPGRAPRSRALTCRVTGVDPHHPNHPPPVVPALTSSPSAARMAPSVTIRAGDRGGDLTGDPGSSPHPHPPARLPHLTSPNHHQGPHARPAEHPRKPPKPGQEPSPVTSLPLPRSPPPLLTVTERPVSQAGYRIKDNTIQRSPVTTL